MEAILRSLIRADYPHLRGRSLTLFRYDAQTDTFPDVWIARDGYVRRRYSVGACSLGKLQAALVADQPALFADIQQLSHDTWCPFHKAAVRGVALAGVSFGSVPWGVLAVEDPRAGGLTAADIPFVQAVARQLGVYGMTTLVDGAGNTELSTVRALAATVDAKDHYTRHHSANVALYSRLLARELRLDPGEVRLIELASLLHDIGKIAIPDQVLQKPGPLDETERLVIQTHSAVGASILAQAPHLKELVPLVRHHHERYDGTGYPDRMKGSEVPIGAAILCLADAFDTMTSKRVYRQPWTLAQAMAEVRRCAGTQFHPEVAAAWDRIVERARQQGEAWVQILEQGPSPEFSPLESQMAAGEAPSPLIQHRDPLDLLIEAQHLARAESLPDLLEQTGQQAFDFWGADAVVIFLAHPREPGLQLAWHRFAPHSPITRALGELADSEILHWLMQSGESLHVSDLRRDERLVAAHGLPVAVSAMAAPVTAGDRILGLILVLRGGEGRYGRHEEKVLRLYGGIAGRALSTLYQGSRTTTVDAPAG